HRRRVEILVRFFKLVFFFRSRILHTRWPRDWNSDVCSSDLHSASPTVTVLVPLDPWATLSDEGLAETEKSGGGGAPPQEGNRNEPMRVLQLKVPLLLMYSCVYQNVQSSPGSMVIAL